MDRQQKEQVKVIRAVIENDGKILAAQRSSSASLPLKWEFPGGKLKKGESPVECIKRELKEELDIEVSLIYPLPQLIHIHDDRVFETTPYVCRIARGSVKCKEHNELMWDEPESLASLDWAKGDIMIYKEYIRHKNKQS